MPEVAPCFVFPLLPSSSLLLLAQKNGRSDGLRDDNNNQQQKFLTLALFPKQK
jgi:hypothetical protein